MYHRYSSSEKWKSAAWHNWNMAVLNHFYTKLLTVNIYFFVFNILYLIFCINHIFSVLANKLSVWNHVPCDYFYQILDCIVVFLLFFLLLALCNTLSTQTPWFLVFSPFPFSTSISWLLESGKLWPFSFLFLDI